MADGFTLPVPAEASAALSKSSNEEGHPWWWHLGWALKDVREARLQDMQAQQQQRGTMDMIAQIIAAQRGGGAAGAQPQGMPGAMPVQQLPGAPLPMVQPAQVAAIQYSDTDRLLGNPPTNMRTETQPGPWMEGYTTPDQAAGNNAVQEMLAPIFAQTGLAEEQAAQPAQQAQPMQRASAMAPLQPVTPGQAPAWQPTQALLPPGQSLSLPLGGGAHYRVEGQSESLLAAERDRSRVEGWTNEWADAYGDRLARGMPQAQAMQEAQVYATQRTRFVPPSGTVGALDRMADSPTAGNKAQQYRDAMMEAPTTPDQVATKQAKSEGLKPGTPEFKARWDALRSESASAVTGARNTAEARPPGDIRKALTGADELFGALDELRRLVDPSVLGPLAGRAATVEEALRGVPKVQAQFMAASRRFAQAYRKHVTGAAAGYKEITDILKAVPSTNTPLSSWLGRWQAAVTEVNRIKTANEGTAKSLNYKVPTVRMPAWIQRAIAEGEAQGVQPPPAAAPSAPPTETPPASDGWSVRRLP